MRARWPFRAEDEFEQRLRAILDNRCTVLVCTPTYALHLAEVAERIGLDILFRHSRHDSRGRAGRERSQRQAPDRRVLGREVLRPRRRDRSRRLGFRCQAEQRNPLNELQFIFEVIDPKTLNG